MIRDADFEARRKKVREGLDDLPGGDAKTSDGRSVFFDAVYTNAKTDPAAVPWADLQAKSELIDYLQENPGTDKRALDVACGLGDNAEAMARAGYDVTAFDVAERAISWAKSRFPKSAVSYEVADLFNPPKNWLQAYDLVHECYTLQALPEELIEKTAAAICALVAPGGRLLIYTRLRLPDSSQSKSGPWPLQEHHLDLPHQSGLTRISDKRFTMEKADMVIPHSFAVWERPQ